MRSTVKTVGPGPFSQKFQVILNFNKTGALKVLPNSQFDVFSWHAHPVDMPTKLKPAEKDFLFTFSILS